MTANTTICNSRFGIPRSDAPSKVKISDNILCDQLGVQNRFFECDFLNILLAAYISPFQFSTGDLAIWGISSFNRNLATALDIMERIYRISGAVFDVATLIASPIKPNEITTQNLCRNAPDQSAYGTRDSYYAAITTALAVGNFDPLFALVAVDYYSVLWLENCQCTPDPDPGFDRLQIFELVTPQNQLGCTGGDDNISQLINWYAGINEHNRVQNVLFTLFDDNPDVPPLVLINTRNLKVVPITFTDRTLIGDTGFGFEPTFRGVPNRIEILRYSTGGIGGCGCDTYYTYNVVENTYIRSNSNQTPTYRYFQPLFSPTNVGKCVTGGVYKQKICRTFPELCGCVKKTIVVPAIVRCGESVNIEVTDVVEQYPNGCLRVLNTVPVSADSGCGSVIKSVESLIVRPEETF